jgi:hypothetical protein
MKKLIVLILALFTLSLFVPAASAASTSQPAKVLTKAGKKHHKKAGKKHRKGHRKHKAGRAQRSPKAASAQ